MNNIVITVHLPQVKHHMKWHLKERRSGRCIFKVFYFLLRILKRLKGYLARARFNLMPRIPGQINAQTQENIMRKPRAISPFIRSAPTVASSQKLKRLVNNISLCERQKPFLNVYCFYRYIFLLIRTYPLAFRRGIQTS